MVFIMQGMVDSSKLMNFTKDLLCFIPKNEGNFAFLEKW